MSNEINPMAFFQEPSVADLRLLACPGAEELTELIDQHLVEWAKSAGVEKDSFIIPCECPRFQSGDAKGLVRESVRGDDIFIVIDPGNYSVTYNLFGYENHLSPDDHFANLKRLIHDGEELTIFSVKQEDLKGFQMEAKRYGVRCDQIALILVLLTSALFIPLLPALLGQYHPTPEVLAMAKKLLYWSIPSLLLFWPRSNTLPSTLRAANDTLYPSVVSLAALWVVTIGLGYVLAIPCKLGLLGVWIAMWASWAIRCVVFSVRFGSGKWLHKALTSR